MVEEADWHAHLATLNGQHFGLNFLRGEIRLSKRLWVEWNFAGPVRSATPRSSPPIARLLTAWSA